MKLPKFADQALDALVTGPLIFSYLSVVAVGAVVTAVTYAVLQGIEFLIDPECISEPGGIISFGSVLKP